MEMNLTRGGARNRSKHTSSAKENKEVLKPNPKDATESPPRTGKGGNPHVKGGGHPQESKSQWKTLAYMIKRTRPKKIKIMLKG